ncbi:MAG: GntR family transcriptional regulator [Roseicyclus sp.]
MTERPTARELAGLRFPGLDPARPTAEQIHESLRSAILSTALAPGCLVSETEIGLKFGASRTPVREAFALLRDDGLIVTRPSRGNYVSKLSEHDIRQAQFLREGLELATVRRLCETGIAPDLRIALEDCLTAQANAVAQDDNGAFQHQDNEFHILLARATGYPRAETLLVREKAALDRLRVLALSPARHKGRLLDEHRNILTAILDKDVERTLAVTRTHLRSILNVLSRLITENRDFFA